MFLSALLTVSESAAVAPDSFHFGAAREVAKRWMLPGVWMLPREGMTNHV
jgi:hypothetical protein